MTEQTTPQQQQLAQRKPRPRKIGAPLPAPCQSSRLLVRIESSRVGMFRFLLEAYENVAYFTVLNRKTALLKIVFSPHQEATARRVLHEIGQSLPLMVDEWPTD